MLFGTGKHSRRDLTSIIQVDLVCEETVLAGKINEALRYCARVPTDGEQQVNVTELSVARKFRDVSTSRAKGCLLLTSSEAPYDNFLLNILKASF